MLCLQIGFLPSLPRRSLVIALWVIFLSNEVMFSLNIYIYIKRGAKRIRKLEKKKSGNFIARCNIYHLICHSSNNVHNKCKCSHKTCKPYHEGITLYANPKCFSYENDIE